MSTSNGGTARTRISNRDVAFYEDNTARQLRIMNLVRTITLLVTDADVLEQLAGPLAQITESAGKTRRALIEHRDRAQGAVVDDAVAGVNDEL